MNLRTWRKTNKLSQSETAEILGINSQHLSKLERGLSPPRIKTALFIQGATGEQVTVQDLLQRWMDVNSRRCTKIRYAGRIAFRKFNERRIENGRHDDKRRRHRHEDSPQSEEASG